MATAIASSVPFKDTAAGYFVLYGEQKARSGNILGFTKAEDDKTDVYRLCNCSL